MQKNAATMTPLKPVVRASIADQVFDALHEQVRSMALPPGTKVSEADIAKQLGVSRQPVRDAFYRLSKLGFLVIRPQKATTVSQIHIADIRRARFLRTAIELEVMTRAAQEFTEVDLADLDANLARQKASVQADDRDGFHELDDAFHRMICDKAGVGYAWDIIRENKAHTDRVRYMSLSFALRRAYDDHIAIMDALRARDVDAARAGIRKHMGQIENSLDQLRKTNHDWFSDAPE